MTPIYVTKLPSGYWHVRFSANRYAQWPSWTQCRASDTFGWDAEEMAKAANKAVTR